MDRRSNSPAHSFHVSRSATKNLSASLIGGLIARLGMATENKPDRQWHAQRSKSKLANTAGERAKKD